MSEICLFLGIRVLASSHTAFDKDAKCLEERCALWSGNFKRCSICSLGEAGLFRILTSVADDVSQERGK